jgi:hypothetical protein
LATWRGGQPRHWREGRQGRSDLARCSVFGAPVALAARCAGVPAQISEDKIVSHTVTFPAAEWGARAKEDVIEPVRYRDPETKEVHDDESSVQKWRLVEPFDFDAKGIGRVGLRQLLDESFPHHPRMERRGSRA